MTVRTAVLTALAALAIAASAPTAGASSSTGEGPVAVASGCGSVKLGGRTYVFFQVKVGCNQAKAWAGKVFKTRGKFEPPGYTCESGSGFKQGGGCSTSSGSKFFGWHPFD